MQTHPWIVDQSAAPFPQFKPTVDPEPLWAFNEMARADFNDARLTSRAQYILRDFSHQPLASIPQACGDSHQAKATYRFCANDKVSFEAILTAHYTRTLERSSSPVILCIQDTTTLNYLAHPATQGLGHLGTKQGKSLGLLLHSTLAVNPEGDCFGLLQAHCWARPQRRRSRHTHRKRGTALQNRETFRWLEGFRQVEQLAQQCPQQQWVSVNDREGDIYEVLHAATAPDQRAGLVVRARHDRALAGSHRSLFSRMRHLPVAGTYTILVPRHAQQPARLAELSVRFAELTLAPPRYHEHERSVTLWGVWAEELQPPPGCARIRWCLLTNVAIRTLDDALERIGWYTQRWNIEEYHRILKSGCRVEARQLTTRARLQRALAIDMVVAWRIMELNKVARTQPDAPADQWLSTAQWQALYCYVHKTQQVPQKPPTINQAVQWIARLGGFLARKSDGQPGHMTLWRGLQRLNDIVEAWHVFGPGQRTPNKVRPKKKKRCG